MKRIILIFLHLQFCLPIFSDAAELNSTKIIQSANQYLEKGNIERAVEIFDKVVELELEVPASFYFIYGESLFKLDALQKAKGMLRLYTNQPEKEEQKLSKALRYIEIIDKKINTRWALQREEHLYDGERRAYFLYTSDDHGNITKKEIYNENDKLVEYVLYTYDSDGNMIREITKSVSSTGEVDTTFKREYTYIQGVLRVEKIYHKHVLWVLKKYNDHGDQKFFQTDSEHDGNKIRETILSEYTYNSQGKKTEERNEITIMRNNETTTTNSVITYKYDDNGNVIEITRPDKTIRYKYEKGRCIRENHSNGWEFTYDYNYDGQIIKEIISRPNGGTRTEQFTYDSNGNLIKHEIRDPDSLYETIIKKRIYKKVE